MRALVSLLMTGCGGGRFAGAEEEEEESESSFCWFCSSSKDSMCLSGLSLVSRSWLV